MSTPVKALLCLLAVWAVVWGVIKLTDPFTPTPEDIIAAIEADPMAGLTDPDDRMKAIGDLANKINRLDYNQRTEFRESDAGRMEGFFEGLSDEERGEFVNLTIEQHFRTMIKAFNEMEPEERRRLIARARKDMARDEEGREQLAEMGGELTEEQDEFFKEVVDKGFRAYYDEASAETKMDLAPLLEEIQARMQGMR